VGRYENASHEEVGLVESWNGTEWTVGSAPTPTGGKQAMFYGVSCVSTSSCVAAGRYESSTGVQEPLVESWNGESWTLVTVPTPSGAKLMGLYGVSCVSSTACMAVGSWTANAEGLEDKPLVESWNGSAWTLKTATEPSGALHSGLAGVSCSSSTACMAVGGYEASPMGSGQKAMIEQWNGSGKGSEWTVSTPAPTGAQWSALKGVSCDSATECTAVGAYGTGSAPKTLVARWNGSEWSIQSSLPKTEGGAELNGVSCTSGGSCLAVGGNEQQPLSEVWNGSEWSIKLDADPGGIESGSFAGVSCGSSTACMAVGPAYLAGALSPLALDPPIAPMPRFGHRQGSNHKGSSLGRPPASIYGRAQ
jgi:hypothetical protein